MKNQVRCSYLDSNGRQCKKIGQFSRKYHGEGELYKTYGDKNTPHWVQVYLCKKHLIRK